ncbi:endo-1,4-beta-xylanase [Asticcacaulis sp. ZE23SCel15]|uniref:endo-1,4-beta-xylanase n=1 Tax=Asticcacaulis sp. ZE23SCel15 TaxID=3059027 RepID=UPI00265FC7B5|nr:endo-1,4-beta-xylanase [Asticcacaulis sp. ZE23SCel15]WKL57627.1 endo-1,4-beta-xylanase [Asticcacaulis sp. ZE23SCel15]
MNRRKVLAGLTATAVAIPAQAQTPSLGDIAATKGIRFGSAAGITKGGLRDPQVADILRRDCRIIVAKNEMKMYTLRNTPAEVYDFSLGDEMLAFCEKHKLPLRGHTLFWAKDEFTPKWLLAHDFGPKPKLAAEKLLRDYIAKVTTHYGDRLTSWDVINEAIDEKTGDIRANVFTRILGDDTLRICFEAAREHLPKMELVYNDYMSWRVKDGLHRKGAIRLLRWFRDHNIPVDALGIQGHLGTDQGAGWDATADDNAPQYADWSAFLDEAKSLGYGLMITEFDVNERRVLGDINKRDQVVAQTAKDYLDLTLSNTAVKDVLCWGMDDKYSWLQTTTPREDRLPLRPTPYDDQFRKKPLWDAMNRSFQSAPDRT